MRWFRFYSEALDDDKVQGLAAPLFKHWVNLLCIASYNQGEIVNLQQAAFRLRLPPKKAEKIITELVDRGLLEPGGEGWAPHNWAGRQFASDDVAGRVRKHRQDVTGNVTKPLRETPPEADTEADTEQNRTDPETEDNIFRLCEQTIGPFDPHMATKLTEAEQEYSWECIQHSFAEASENNARSWRYVEAILKAHKVNGCYTARRAEAAARGNEEDWEERYQRGKARTKS